MERKTFSVVFFCKKTKVTKKGKAPIYVRIKTCGTATEIYTRCQIEPERWNQRLERSLYKDEIDQQINSIVASYRVNVLAAYDQLIKEGKEPTCFAIKHRLENPSVMRGCSSRSFRSIATNGRKRSEHVSPNSRRTSITACFAT